jgi:hypothetical protein
MNTTKASVERKGNLNPMWGRKHTPETKEKISNSQKARYNAIRKAIKEQSIIDYGDDSPESRKRVLSHLLNNNDLKFDNMKQVADFLFIMIGKDRLSEIVRSQVDKLIAESYKVGNDEKRQNPC